MEKNILLVDDESSLRRSLFLSLKQEGYSVEPCENGINAIKKLHLFEQNNVDLDTVVLDINLPDIDGIKLGKIIKSKYPNASIIFITGYSDKVNEEEVEEITDNKILEKPFTAKQLTAQIEEILKEKAITAIPSVKPQPKESQPQQQTYSAYALLKMEQNADLFGTYRNLYFDKNVLYCDAVKGEYDIVLLIQSSTPEGCREICENNIKKIDGIKEVEYLDVTNPLLEDSLKNILNTYSIDSSDNQRKLNNVVCSYVLVEIEQEKLDSIYPTLSFEDNVVSCDYTDSRYSLVLLVQGTQFNEIDNLVKNKIATLDGVLKVKEFPIITLFEM
jgi:DNA-binding response OmpR family regulator